MFKATYIKHQLKFKIPATTSRGTILEKDSYYLKLQSIENPNLIGVGEASPLKGLSIDAVDNFEAYLKKTCDDINKINDIPEELELKNYPSIEFALETALLDLENGGIRKIFDTDFYNKEVPIEINGLVWMADKETMKKQIKEKVEQGFYCIKLKVGALNFSEELELLSSLRKEFSEKDVTIRLDANGAFDFKDVLEKLKRLSEFKIHSIEQPIKQGQWGNMSKLCKESPIPIALDEELIGITSLSGKKLVLDIIKPQYIILKPTLLGGLQESQEWLELAHEKKLGWWITSALESNIGLNAISQWASSLYTEIPQGLGTGALYTNNIKSPLEVEKGALYYRKNLNWDLNMLQS